MGGMIKYVWTSLASIVTDQVLLNSVQLILQLGREQ